MRKKLFLLLTVVVAAGYLIGNYFVEFALKRGEDGSPPAACASIADPNLKAPPAPDADRELWTITSSDGLKLAADRFKPSEESHRWALLVHGYGRDRSFAYDYAEAYLEHGWNVVTPDLRAAGESEGNYITMGAKESDDLIGWIAMILKNDPQAEIILHGVSMGAATVMMTSAKDLPLNVKAVVEDCGYTSAYEMFGAQLKKLFGLPEFPIMKFVDVVSKIETGVAVSEAAPLHAVGLTKVPMLFIHGDADGLVPYEMMGRLVEASGAPIKETWTVAGAGHADAKPSNPEAYFERVFAFIDRYVGNARKSVKNTGARSESKRLARITPASMKAERA